MSAELSEGKIDVSGQPICSASPISNVGTWVEHLAARKDAAAVVKDIVTVLALIIGGLWTFALTKQYRETAPRVSLSHEISGWRLSSGSTLIRVGTRITNTGKVLVKGVKGQLFVIRLLPETPEQKELAKNGNIFFDCSPGGRKIQGCIPEQGLNVPERSKRSFHLLDPARTLEPGESELYWRYMIFEEGATMVELHVFVENGEGDGGGWSADSVHSIRVDVGVLE